MKHTPIEHLQALAGNKLKTRSTPKQARALARLQGILVSTAQVLEQHAPADLSTSLIAEHAKIPVSSIYRYFPTLEELLDELYEQSTEQLHARLMDSMSGWNSEASWKDNLLRTLDIIREFLNSRPFYRALHLLIMAQRGPQTVHEERHVAFIQFLTDRWENGLDGFSGGDPEVVARICVQMALTLEDLVARQTDSGKEAIYFNELNRAIEQYLGHYLKP
ncbi:TetR/AcrR family transcriptional regulator [Flexibacterium corallicola]|uniref:TetR/AcrR family transcriptional regulator n=1 Tax=Flexibacterium corallicola TaxID=3037259 RepID=UPI00286F8EB3|nr:helix-turn-helix domain-containing protein [Pseudovibrio sp. M1P-2-3]